MIEKNGWVIVYKKAIQDDGSLLFPERLTEQFLEQARRTMGSYLFANQYQNEVIPLDKQTFKRSWFKYYNTLPDHVLSFGFIDPAISEADTADYTGMVVISVDVAQNWYIRLAKRERINPTELIQKCFELTERFKLTLIGVEDVAFQKAIIHFAWEEMKRRGKQIPLIGVKRGADKTKEMRILSLVPRFEWGSIFLTQGLGDLEMELLKFPRGSHDDLIDSLSSIESIVHYPQPIRSRNEQPAPNSPQYESWYIKQLVKRGERGNE